MKNTILSVQNLSVIYKIDNGIFRSKTDFVAVNKVSFDLYQGEVLGIVGESGCGKSSLARSLVGLNTIDNGQAILLDKYNLAHLKPREWGDIYKYIQFIFQDPIASLNPRMTVFDIIAEPLLVNYPKMKNNEVYEKVVQMMQMVGLTTNQINRYPQEFSGGQCQRIGIARALILNPKVLICDESVSALDVSIKAQIINLLIELKQKFSLTIVFISHDLSIVRHLSDRVLVMYKGEIVELNNCNDVFNNPKHVYTQKLLASVPCSDPKTARMKRL